MGGFASTLQGNKLDKHKRPPEEVIQQALETNCVIPCENYGPYMPQYYHSNVQGAFMAFASSEACENYMETERINLAAYGSWGKVDVQNVSADWAMQYGAKAFGSPFPFKTLKPMIESARDQSISSYESAGATVKQAEREEYENLTTGKRYATRGMKGEVGTCQNRNDILELYADALRALCPLYDLSVEIADAAGGVGNGVELSWGLKKLLRVKKKLVEKYDQQANRVTDIARTSLVFGSLKALRKGLDYLLENYEDDCTIIKNRFVSPTNGYVDVLVNCFVEKHLCEIQFHISAVYRVKGESGHNAYKWFRRLLLPDDIYKGERNEAGEPHGRGEFTFATGNRFEGEVQNGQPHGQGQYSFANGNVYDGEFEGGKPHGVGMYRFASGNSYEGDFFEGLKHGKGTYNFADGEAAVLRFEKDQETGEGTKWSADRRTAWKLMDGNPLKEITLEEAAIVAGNLEQLVPQRSITLSQVVARGGLKKRVSDLEINTEDLTATVEAISTTQEDLRNTSTVDTVQTMIDEFRAKFKTQMHTVRNDIGSKTTAIAEEHKEFRLDLEEMKSNNLLLERQVVALEGRNEICMNSAGFEIDDEDENGTIF